MGSQLAVGCIMHKSLQPNQFPSDRLLQLAAPNQLRRGAFQQLFLDAFGTSASLACRGPEGVSRGRRGRRDRW